MDNFKWNLDSIVNINGVSYTITLPHASTGHIYFTDHSFILDNIDNQVGSMSEFPQVQELLNKVK